MAVARLPTELRRAEIADAILRLIGSRGISALTMAAVASEIGITSGALFRHFASRDEMLDEAARRAEEMLSATFPANDLPPLERLEQFVLRRADVLGANAGLARLMLSEQFALALPEPAALRLKSLVKRTVGFIVESLRDAAARGDIRSDVPPEDLALLVLGAVQTVALTGGAGGPAGLLAGKNVPTRVWTSLAAVLAPVARTRKASGSRGSKRRGER